MTTLGLAPVYVVKLLQTNHLLGLLFIPVTEIAALVVIVIRHEVKNMVSEVEVANFFELFSV